VVVANLPFAAWGLVSLTGLNLFWWFGLIFVFGLVPLADLVAGRDTTSPPDEALDWLEQDRYYRWVTCLFLPVQYTALI
jgi:alkane 1-monooxygenase